MIDINDSSEHATPHLIIVIDVRQNDFTEEVIKELIKIPIRDTKSRKKESSFWLKKGEDRDAIHIQLCDDNFTNIDFENKSFIELIEATRISHINRASH